MLMNIPLQDICIDEFVSANFSVNLNGIFYSFFRVYLPLFFLSGLSLIEEIYSFPSVN